MIEPFSLDQLINISTWFIRLKFAIISKTIRDFFARALSPLKPVLIRFDRFVPLSRDISIAKDLVLI